MSRTDTFSGLARFYDPIMSHVNYERWYRVTTGLSPLLPKSFAHLDVACGTGVLLKRLWKRRWRSFGIDLSRSMLVNGAKGAARWPVAQADIRALPFSNSIDFITCLFDSINFLLSDGDMRAGVRGMCGALAPGGLIYLDAVTERMVLDHFADQQWTERSKRVSTRWDCSYDRSTRVAVMKIQVNKGETYTLNERIYPIEQVEQALLDADMKVLAVLDAETWRPPTKKTLRVDFVAVRGDGSSIERPFRQIHKQLQEVIR